MERLLKENRDQVQFPYRENITVKGDKDAIKRYLEIVRKR